MNEPISPQTIHATCVSIQGRGVLIRGASGSGKSSLALQLMAFGATLVSDDRSCLSRAGKMISADAPPTIKGMIEARGVGILQVPAQGPVPIVLVIDMDQSETDRLPHPHCCTLLGVSLPCLYNAPSPHFAAAILQYLKHSIVGSP